MKKYFLFLLFPLLFAACSGNSNSGTAQNGIEETAEADPEGIEGNAWKDEVPELKKHLALALQSYLKSKAVTEGEYLYVDEVNMEVKDNCRAFHCSLKIIKQGYADNVDEPVEMMDKIDYVGAIDLLEVRKDLVHIQFEAKKNVKAQYMTSEGPKQKAPVETYVQEALKFNPQNNLSGND